jgi:peptidoglycan DL-endopeptidase CwlO
MKPSLTGVVAVIVVIVLAAGLAGYAAQGRLGPTASTSQVQATQNETSSSLGSLATSTTVLASSSASSSNQTVATNSTATTSEATSTTATSSSSCTTPVDTNSTDGLTIRTFLPSSITIGDSACIKAILSSNNQTTITSLSGSIKITDAQGDVVFQSALVPFEAGSLQLADGSQLSFQFLWNTTTSYLGVTAQPGICTVTVILQFDGMQPLTYIESSANFTLTG